MNPDKCPWCAAPAQPGPKCPRCGADYAKAAQIRQHGKAIAPEAPAPDSPGPASTAYRLPGQGVPPVPQAATTWSLQDGPAVADALLEYRFCLLAIPLALVMGAVFHLLMPGLQRIFLGMPVHELGHALTAWFCGHWAVPTLWKTLWGEERSLPVVAVLAAFLGLGAVRAWRADRVPAALLGVALLTVQLACTFGLRPAGAMALVTWGGDGTGMIVATALMACFFFGKRTQLYRGSLRWGFLVIGAGAFADIFGSWWHARTDADSVPFGENEGSGLSDPLVLLEQHHWMTRQIIQRYVVTGLCCLAVLALVYAWGVWRARQLHLRTLPDTRQGV